MGWRLVPGATLVAVRWRNGLGTSWEIAGEMGEDVPLWQVSIAALERDGAFSDYPFCDRVFTPLEGEVALAVGDGGFAARPVLAPFGFAGDVATACRVGVPGRAFNAIVDRRRYRVGVRVVREGGARVEAARVVVHCVSGGAEVGGVRAGVGDSVVGSGAGVVAGVGIWLVVEVD